MACGDQLPEQVGTCPQCGAPLYSTGRPTQLGGMDIQYTCTCRLNIGLGNTAHPPECDHCYCQRDGGGTAAKPHKVCCKCGDRVLAGGTYITTVPPDGTTTSYPPDITWEPPYDMSSANVSCNVSGCWVC